MFSAPHGVICARILPFVMETNVRALLGREPDSPPLVRYGQVAQLLTGNAAARASDGVEWIQELCAVLKVPALSEFGLTEQHFSTAVAKAKKASSMKGNPIELTEDELLDILRQAGD
jgi:alcohol dehydrogenase class IV